MSWTPSEEIINLLREQLGLDDVFFTLEKVWDREVGIEGVEITGYKNGTIFARTQSSVANYEITIRKGEIVKRLNQYISGQKIKNIKISIK
ncbi:MAG: hypothetical protein LBS15_03010 [Endomicrobium sp.]|jgi:hypothetical protein|nr:hypothetical protein [Endomicrobium sp.]